MKDIYPVYSSTNNELLAIFHDIAGYSKTQYIVLLKLLGLPCLDLLIVTKFSAETRSKIRAFAQDLQIDSFLLRHDKNPEYPPYPRGGYIVGLNEVEYECEKYFSQNRIVMLMEPYSPYDNLRNVSILIYKEYLTFEVAGPGFDVSDLQRGDMTPHEELIFLNTVEYQERLDCISHSVISDGDYRRGVAQRYLKIGHRLVDLGLEKNSSNMCDLVRIAKSYLLKHNFMLLLENEMQYSAIDYRLLKQIYEHIYMFECQVWHYIPNLTYPFVLSSSVLNRSKRLIFWDVVQPVKKYQMSPR
jgi:hypothetical protein